MILSVLVLILLVSVILLQNAQNDNVQPKPLKLEVGDFFQYSVSGFEGNDTVSSKINYTVTNSGIFCDSMDVYSGVAENFAPQILKPYVLDYPVAVELIETPFGQKCVKTIVSSFERNGEGIMLVFTNVGYDSLIVYRMVAARPGLHFTIAVTGTNNVNISQVDTTVHSDVVNTLKYKIKSEPSQLNWNGDYEINSGGSGIVEVLPGQSIRYNMTGQPISIFFMSMNDIAQIKEGGNFSYVDGISLINQVGNVNSVVAPGTYWLMWDVHYMSGLSNATFTYYWGN